MEVVIVLLALAIVMLVLGYVFFRQAGNGTYGSAVSWIIAGGYMGIAALALAATAAVIFVIKVLQLLF